jgi:hypothetical protein
MEQTIAQDLAPVSPLNEFQQAALAQAEKELEDLRKELSTKKYLLEVDKRGVELLKTFIVNDAVWKFTEALGIVEVTKELDTIKDGKLFIKALAIEAIYYYMSKVEGTGTKPVGSAFPSIAEYLRILKAITAGVERVKADNEKLNNAEFVLAARLEGIEPDSSINAVEE